MAAKGLYLHAGKRRLDVLTTPVGDHCFELLRSSCMCKPVRPIRSCVTNSSIKIN